MHRTTLRVEEEVWDAFNPKIRFGCSAAAFYQAVTEAVIAGTFPKKFLAEVIVPAARVIDDERSRRLPEG